MLIDILLFSVFIYVAGWNPSSMRTRIYYIIYYLEILAQTFGRWTQNKREKSDYTRRAAVVVQFFNPHIVRIYIRAYVRACVCVCIQDTQNNESEGVTPSSQRITERIK